MTRTAWIAIVLLLASNGAWFALTVGDEEPAADPFFTTEALEAEVAELQDEVRRLRAGGMPPDLGPGLVGTGGASAAATSAESGAGGDSGAPSGAGRAPGSDGAAVSAAEEARKAAERKHQEQTLETIKATLQKIMQVKDPALRREGLAELAAGLESTDAMLVEYSLSALHSLRTTEIERGVFRGAVLDLLESENGGIRRAALYALHSTGAQPGDLARTLQGAADEDPVVRQHVARVLRLHNGGAFEGDSAKALAALLRDDTLDVRRGTVRALYGVELPESAEQALVEMASRPAERYEAVQHGLSVAKNKSRGVIDALFTHLEDENGRVRQRAHWGLQRSIPDENKPYVARRYAEHLEKFVNPKTHQEALKLIARFGDASLAPQLDRFADNELVDARVRDMAARAAEYLRSK